MTEPLDNVTVLLRKRLEVTQEIAAANVEHLRLNQKAGGLMILEMKDEENGAKDQVQDQERLENFRALEVNLEKINVLEAQLRTIDEELEKAVEEEEK